VYSNINFHQFTSNYTNSVGFGFRYRTPVGPLRIDIGPQLERPPGVKATQYFVTLGQAFRARIEAPQNTKKVIRVALIGLPTLICCSSLRQLWPYARTHLAFPADQDCPPNRT